MSIDTEMSSVRFARKAIYEAPELYDLDYQAVDELQFYRPLILSQAEGTWLEVGAGTGRLTLPLARDAWALGRRCIAVEPAAPMRALLHNRIAREGLHDAVNTVPTGVVDMPIAAARVGAVIFPFNGVLHLMDAHELNSAFRRIHEVLTPGGLFAMDASGVYGSALARGTARLRDAPPFRTASELRAVDGSRWWSADRYRYDEAARAMHIDVRYWQAGASIGTEVLLIQRQWLIEQLIDAIEAAHLRVVSLQSTAQSTSWHRGSARTFIVARRVH